MKNRSRVICMLFLPLLLFGGCERQPGSTGPSAFSTVSESPPVSSPAESRGEEPPREEHYEAPRIDPPVFRRELALGEGDAWIDVSSVSLGYVAVSAKSEARLKFQVICGETVYTYDLPGDGTPAFPGLQSGNGSYEFKIYENVGGTSYLPLFAAEAQVTLEDEFSPFLLPGPYAAYTGESRCVALAEELAESSAGAVDLIGQIYSYICTHVKYDHEKAASVEDGYVPVPDETLDSGRGICGDYASLAASMLRSQGIPTKIIYGYVSPGELYHAWNMFYTEETGWITADFQVNAGDWTRMDCTFSANGSDPSVIGDGVSYTDVYVY